MERFEKPDQIFCPIKDLEAEKNSHEISEFARKAIIEPVFVYDPDEFISNIFARHSLMVVTGLFLVLNHSIRTM